jgi:DNA-binding protein H-NS
MERSMAKTLAQINRQIDKLQRQAEALKKQEISGVISRIRSAIDHYGLTARDLGLTSGRAGASGRAARKSSGRKSVAMRKPVPVKYRDQDGHTWTGRGKRPNWFRSALEAGKKPEDFAV